MLFWHFANSCVDLKSSYTHCNTVAGAVAGIRTHVAAIVWVSRPALNPPRHKSTLAARQTESDPAPTTLFPLFYFWVVPVRLGPPPLPALTPDRSPPRPPILAHLDPHTSCWVRLDPQSWPALAPDRCPPWPTILTRLDLLWASTQKFQAGIVQYNQFAVDAGTSDTKCRRSCRWDSNPHCCDCLSQPSSTQPNAPQEYSGGEADRVWPGALITNIQEIYSTMNNQINQQAENNEIIIARDINAKLAIDREDCSQPVSRNGKILTNIITDNNLITASLQANHGIWTRVNRQKTSEKSVIDYVLKKNPNSKKYPINDCGWGRIPKS